MKKVFALLISLSLLSMCVLSGCDKNRRSKSKKDKDQDQEEETEIESTGNLAEAVELYASKVPEKDRLVEFYTDGISGSGWYMVESDSVYFSYCSLTYSELELHIDPVNETAYFNFTIKYNDETRYYGTNYYNPTGLNDIESFIDDLASLNSDNYEIHDDAALADHEEDIKHDVPILYSRFIVMADNAFPEIGMGLEDIGVDLGDKYREVDPASPLSSEAVIENEHVFENGICTDCGMVWTEYYYDVIGELDGATEDGWRSVYGQNSDWMISSQDYVQYSSSDTSGGDLFYHHMEENMDSFECYIFVHGYDEYVYSNIMFIYSEGVYSKDQGLIGYKFKYTMTVDADAGKFDEVFASKEDLDFACEVELKYTDDDGKTQNAWKDMTEKEIKEVFEEEGCTYYTEEEFLDMVWENHEQIFESFDAGMANMETTLADIGINWK